MRPVSVAVTGLGYWGPNLARTLAALPDCELRWLCDRSLDARAAAALRHPQARVTASFDDVLSDRTLDAVAIATPVPTHFALVRRALEAGKHVFVEKPLALSEDEANELVRLAEERHLTLLVGHVLLFHPAVRRLKEVIDGGELGAIHYLYANRQNLGKIRSDENVLWSLGAHDVSVLLYLLEDEPNEVSARGESYIQPGVADVVFGYLRFPSGIAAHIHLSWLDPHKLRKLTVVGSKGMAVFDDIDPERKLTLYDKTALPPVSRNYGEHVRVQFGDITCLHVANDEPLRVQCEHFLETVRSGGGNVHRAHESARVVAVLEALQRSLDRGGTVESPLGGGRAASLRLLRRTAQS